MKPAGATRLLVVPCELDEANAFVLEHHRHLGPVPEPCRFADCWCRVWPPVRRVMSTGDRYTMDEVEPGVFVYRYLVDSPPIPQEATR